MSLAFAVLRVLPGDAISAQMAVAGLGATEIEARKSALGLDRPLPAQYADYVLGLLRGDMGVSLYTGENVSDIIAARAASTLALAGVGFAVLLTTATILAVGAARTGVIGRFSQITIVASVAIPSYVTGTLIIAFFGLAEPGSMVGTLAAGIILGFHTSGIVAQSLAASVVEITNRQYISAALARGLRKRHVYFRHVLPNAMLPVLPLLSVQAGFLLSGTVVTEMVFARPGLGQLMLDSMLRRDLPVVQGLVLCAALAYWLSMTAAEMVAFRLDPRRSC